ncbi:uncharacterized protein LOC126326205 [Schistocerca gregaria]|uniref:uncharacterized protein LOC126326205 n=1 Tax=Schistocerca gregaria TaxID=7010 RepID=UPI00211EACD4|nr:uncharacterized protein LOC126326205 [Schistocerca gregaria]
MRPINVKEKHPCSSSPDLSSQEYNFCDICTRNIEHGAFGWKRHHYSDKHGWFLQNLLESWLTVLKPILSWRRPLSLEQAISDQKKAHTKIGTTREEEIYNAMSSDDKSLLQIVSGQRDHLLAQPFGCSFCKCCVDFTPFSEEASNKVCNNALTEDIHEMLLPRIWKHFSSEEHRKQVFDFWRHHRMEHHAKKNLERSSSDKPEYSRRGKKITFNPNFKLFQVESFFLTALQLQSKLEDWSYLNRLLNDQNIILTSLLEACSVKSTKAPMVDKGGYEAVSYLVADDDANYPFANSSDPSSLRPPENYGAVKLLAKPLKYGSNKKKAAPWDKGSHDKLSYACFQRLSMQTPCDADSTSRSVLPRKRTGVAWAEVVRATLKENPDWTAEISVETLKKTKFLTKKTQARKNDTSPSINKKF